jgi:hypothetical protein
MEKKPACALGPAREAGAMSLARRSLINQVASQHKYVDYVPRS